MQIPYFNAQIFLENKTSIGKVDEIFGIINAPVSHSPPCNPQNFLNGLQSGGVSWCLLIKTFELSRCNKYNLDSLEISLLCSLIVEYAFL